MGNRQMTRITYMIKIRVKVNGMDLVDTREFMWEGLDVCQEASDLL